MIERVLNACPACARQYDVSHLADGTTVRCDCDEVFQAQRPKPGAAKALKCSGCGGAVPLGAPSCPYCQAEIAAEDRGFGLRCPHCFARGRSGADFCAGCGGKLEPRARPAVPDGRKCPRCEGALRGENLEGLPLVECTACAGVWLTPGAFETMLLRSKQSAVIAHGSGTGAVPPLAEEQVSYIPCVGCGELMTRKRIGSRDGAVVDICRHHGMWFDAGELERILTWVRAGGEAHTPWTARRDQLDPKPFIATSKRGRSGPTRNADLVAWMGMDAGFDLFGMLGAVFFEDWFE